MPDLLLEILSEEIPARMQAKARENLGALVLKGLDEAGVQYGVVETYSTPRRLVLHVAGLPERTPDLSEERKGPRTDAPEKALAGFLRSTGLAVDQLERRADKKGEVFFAVIEKPGRPLSDALADIIPGVIRGFPWPKSMRWGTGDLRWVRPLTSILCLLESEVVPFDVDGYASGNQTRGHRMVDPEPFSVNGFEAYRQGLAERRVTLEPAAREAEIAATAKKLCEEAGVTLIDDPALLHEVGGLVEWPVPLIGVIEDEFRDLPPEVLQTSMREHQKYFSASDASGRVTHFVAVANVQGADGGETIVKGNAKVLRARLADAKFFWENDLRAVKGGGLEDMAASLTSVTFHNKLGSQAERVDRIAALARDMAPVTGADAVLAEQAARICKADLASEMVYEFPELQGLMGRYYAVAAGLDARVAAAAEDHYSPLGPSDSVPSEAVSVSVALADKIDTLAGFWAIEEKPTGTKDPFALRRAALGVIRLILENGVRMRLSEPVGVALMRHVYLIGRRDAVALGEPLFEEDMRATVGDLLAFIADRLKVLLRDRGITHDLIDAVYALGDQDDLVLLVKRVDALQSFLGTEDGKNLLAGYKRAANILAAEEKKEKATIAPHYDAALLRVDEEQALAGHFSAVESSVKGAVNEEDFELAMKNLSILRNAIDRFFDKVTVNADDPALRINRLALLARIRQVMGIVADFSKIEG